MTYEGLLSSMVEEQIAREGSHSSLMIRAGLLKEMLDALAWYADPISFSVTQMNEPRSAVHADNGKRARKALGLNI